jgi:hypothetical protein
VQALVEKGWEDAEKIKEKKSMKNSPAKKALPKNATVKELA